VSRHEGFVNQAKAGHIDVLFMGGFHHGRLARQGKNVWDKFYCLEKCRQLRHRRRSKTEHVLWRIENGELEGIDPKVIVLMIGTNNSGSNSPDQISEGVEKIVGDFRSKLPKSKILLLAIFPRGKPDANPKQMDTINKVKRPHHEPGRWENDYVPRHPAKVSSAKTAQLHADVMPELFASE